MTVHRVQGLTVEKAIVTLNNNFFESGQAYVALSRVRKLDDLVLWNFSRNAIMLSPYYKQLLKWCDSVDVSEFHHMMVTLLDTLTGSMIILVVLLFLMM